jgi:hypothetical protein
MSVLTEEARTTLKETFEEVASRANRLQEWIGYQEKLHPLKNSFSVVLNEAEIGITPNGFEQNALSRIRNRWVTCRDTDLLNLQIFHEEVQFIDKPVVPNARVRYDAARFFTLRDLIEADVVAVSPLTLKSHCSEFDTALTFQLAVLRTSVQNELAQLCDLTRELYKDFAR